MWLRSLEVRDLRNLQDVRVELSEGLNVLMGRNAQGKTSLLEAAGLLARGRSFRTEQTASLIRRGADSLFARGVVAGRGPDTLLEVQLGAFRRQLRVDGRDVRPGAYHGRLEVVVYSTDRLRVVRGPMAERRRYLDRGAAALWPAYRQLLADYERVVVQRNAALEARRPDLDAWDERFVELGACLRSRRAAYVGRLRTALDGRYAPSGEAYDVRLDDEEAMATDALARRQLAGQVEERRREEFRARRTLVGPHRDPVRLLVSGTDAVHCSSGQARSLLLALVLAAHEVYRRERGTPPVTLLDDLDSELDEERVLRLCHVVAGHGQTLLTTAHGGWTRALGTDPRRFRVTAGRVAPEET